jgi:putative transcriptional regulator
MKKELFDELCQSILEAGELNPKNRTGKPESRHSLWSGKVKARAFNSNTNLVSLSRSKLHLSQAKFAALLGVSVKSLRNWEQGRRKPTGAAKVLLEVAVRHPEAILDTVAKTK